jgi:sugar/nucleoside kinase (ribokinase family)
LEIQTLRKLRESYHGIIYIDIHSSTLAINNDGSRCYRQPDNWEELLNSGDIVQMNLKEMLTLLGRTSESPDNLKVDEIAVIGKQIMMYGPRIFILTLGSLGAILFINYTDRTVTLNSKPDRIGYVEGEATGCGDVLSSAFIIAILSGSCLQESLEYAVNVASQKYRFPGLTGIPLLEKYARYITSKQRFSIDNILSK